MQRFFIALTITIGIAFLLGFAASRGVFGPQGWAVALIVGAAVSSSVAVLIVPLSHRGDAQDGGWLHMLRR